MFNVYVSRDDRIEDRGYDMGLGPLWDTPDVNVEFMADRDGPTIGPDELEGADALVLLKEVVDARTVGGVDELKIISRFGAGFDNVDIETATSEGIAVTNAPQGMRNSVAQATVGMLIACASNFRRYDNLVRETGFQHRLENMGVELFGKTLGSIGLGQIGGKVVDLVSPFEMDVRAYDPHLSSERASELGIEKVDLDTLLRTSDFVTIHCPLTEETEHMLGSDSFRKMKDDAYLVNTSRGGIYPDADLARAIEEGEIAGAAIDVFEDEPDVSGNSLLALDDCLVTPHAAGINRDGLTQTGEVVSKSVLAVMNGDVPMNLLNPSVYSDPVPDEKLSPSYR